MIVDDEVTIAGTLRTITMQSGFASFAFYDAASAIDLARVVPPDLLLTDFALPGMNGMELAIHLSESCPGCKIILFSGQVSAADVSRMSRPRSPEFVLLEKPVHPDVLLTWINHLLQSSATGKQALRWK